MRRDLSQTLKTLEGEDFTPPVTLEFVCFTAATANLPSDMGLSVERKLQLYNLAKKIKVGGIVDFTAEDMAILKERISAAFTIVTLGRAIEALESDPPTMQ